MLQSPTIAIGNSRSDGELCRNACGFYGNKIWDGFCSKCYREVYQQAKQIQQTYDGKLSTSDSIPPPSEPSFPAFSSFQEKRRSNISMRNPIRQMVNRAGSLRSSSSSVVSALLNEEQTLESEATTKHLDVMINDDARLDIKSQVKTFANHFSKKCSNKNIHLDTLIHDYETFKDTIKKRIQTNSIYRDENEDLMHRIRDYVERIIFSKNYSSIFNRIAITHEEQDLSIQNRISSLHWVTSAMLDTVINEDIPNVREAIYKAINALIELDSITTPQGKIDSIMECKSFTEEAIRTSGSSNITINADCFLPALIYVVLKAKPPRLHSNIQFLSHFSQPNGEQLYYLANLDSAVRFIELLQAQHLGLSSTDFSLYMRGEPILPSRFVPLFDYPLENNSTIQELRKMFILYHELDHHYEKFSENLHDFTKRLAQSVTDIGELVNGSYTRFSYFEQIPESVDVENNEKEIIDSSDQSTIENDHLPEIVQEETEIDN